MPCRARTRHADRRRAAAAVVVSRRRGGAGLIAAAGLAAADIWRLRSGQAQQVTVDMRHAVVECRSERYLRVDGQSPPPAWDAIAGVYKTGDHRFVRLHTNFPHHRDAVCNVLNCAAERDQVQAALMQWDGEAFETAAYAGGGVVALMRPHDEWAGAPQAEAIGRTAADRDREDRRGRSKAVAGRRSPAGRTARAGSVPGHRRAGRRPHAGGAWRRCDAGLEPGSAGDSLARPSTPDAASSPVLSISRPQQGREALRGLLAQADILLAGLSPARAGGARVFAAERRRAQPGHRLCLAVGLWPRRAMGGAARLQFAGAVRDRLQPCRRAGRRRRGAEGIAGADARPCHRLPDGVRRDDGAGAAVARRRQLACPGVAGTHRPLVVGDWAGSPMDLATADLPTRCHHAVCWKRPHRVSDRCARFAMPPCCRKTPASWSRPAMPLGSHPPRWPARN